MTSDPVTPEMLKEARDGLRRSILDSPAFTKLCERFTPSETLTLSDGRRVPLGSDVSKAVGRGLATHGVETFLDIVVKTMGDVTRAKVTEQQEQLTAMNARLDQVMEGLRGGDSTPRQRANEREIAEQLDAAARYTAEAQATTDPELRAGYEQLAAAALRESGGR